MTYFHQLVTYGTVLRLYEHRRELWPTTVDHYVIMPPRWVQQRYRSPEVRKHYKAGRYWVGDLTRTRRTDVEYIRWSRAIGTRCRWRDLPGDVQDFAREIFPEYAPVRL